MIIPNEEKMLSLAANLALCVQGSGVSIFLYGNLGAGKTTFARGFIQGLGYQDKVKSPTYTIVEPYQIDDKQIYHFDLYRINDPEELSYLGIHDYFTPQTICLVEWPEHGKQWLPASDLSCYIEPHLNGRQIRFVAYTEVGEKILQLLQKKQYVK